MKQLSQQMSSSSTVESKRSMDVIIAPSETGFAFADAPARTLPRVFVSSTSDTVARSTYNHQRLPSAFTLGTRGRAGTKHPVRRGPREQRPRHVLGPPSRAAFEASRRPGRGRCLVLLLSFLRRGGEDDWREDRDSGRQARIKKSRGGQVGG